MQPFQTFILSAGVVVDYVGPASLHTSGTCGGAACVGSGRLNEANAVGELKLSTLISSMDSIYSYIGAGAGWRWLRGMPTGAGGPSVLGSDVAPQFRIGVGYNHRIDDKWSVGFSVGTAFTGETRFRTTLIGEDMIAKRDVTTLVRFYAGYNGDARLFYSD